MRILHVAPITRDRPTGPGHSVPLQMLAEQRQGHDVALLQSYRGLPPSVPDGTLRFAWPAPAQLAPGPFPAEALFERHRFRPDVVHFHSVYLPWHARIATAVRRLGIPTVNSPRGGLMPEALATRAWKKRVADLVFFDRFCRGLALHRALNEPERRACLARYPQVPVHVAANPIDLDTLPALARRRRERGELVVGFLGRLDVYTKGLDLLLDGFRAALDAGLPSGVRLRVAGPDHRGGAADLARRVRALALGQRVEIGGARTGAEKLAFLGSLDLFVHPSRHEALPMGVLEAMAVGRAVVVTPETNLAGLVERHGAGWSVAGDAAAVAACLRTLAAAPDAVDARGAAGRVAVQAECSLDAVGTRLSDAYRIVLDRAERRVA